ncbi:MAG: Uma2 family endonuclease [Moorea sp. SIO2B7]|nr:Uma2 family endonuclease [Moorena sp. SIO2B7]
MNTVTETKIKWTTSDLELLPESSNRYEIIDGDLEMTRAPHWKHQNTILALGTSLRIWSLKTGLGVVIINPGIRFDDADNVIPDLVWISKERLELSVDESGHFTTAPELILEVLSESVNDIRRDREAKLKLYSNRGVQEYWIADWRLKQLEVYRRNQGKLELVMTLLNDEEITTGLLPSFSGKINQFFI